MYDTVAIGWAVAFLPSFRERAGKIKGWLDIDSSPIRFEKK